MENTNCVICLEDKTEIKCKYCSVSFHYHCYKEYNKIECPQCKNNLPELDGKLKYSRCIRNMFDYYGIFEIYMDNCSDYIDDEDEDCDSFFNEIIKQKIDYLINNIDKIQQKFDIKTFLNIFNKNNLEIIDNYGIETLEFEFKCIFGNLKNEKIIEYCIYINLFNENFSNFVSNNNYFIEGIDKKFIIHEIIKRIHNMASNPKTNDFLL